MDVTDKLYCLRMTFGHTLKTASVPIWDKPSGMILPINGKLYGEADCPKEVQNYTCRVDQVVAQWTETVLPCIEPGYGRKGTKSAV